MRTVGWESIQTYCLHHRRVKWGGGLRRCCRLLLPPSPTSRWQKAPSVIPCRCSLSVLDLLITPPPASHPRQASNLPPRALAPPTEEHKGCLYGAKSPDGTSPIGTSRILSQSERMPRTPSPFSWKSDLSFFSSVSRRPWPFFLRYLW